MAHDVFVCYSSEDKTIANPACAKLESAGIRCWIAPRDPIAGIPYGRQLVDAITAARVVLLIFSGNANRSEHVLRELEVASDGGKIIVPFRIENVVPSGDPKILHRAGTLARRDVATDGNAPERARHADAALAGSSHCSSTAFTGSSRAAKLFSVLCCGYGGRRFGRCGGICVQLQSAAPGSHARRSEGKRETEENRAESNARACDDGCRSTNAAAHLRFR